MTALSEARALVAKLEAKRANLAVTCDSCGVQLSANAVKIVKKTA